MRHLPISYFYEIRTAKRSVFCRQKIDISNDILIYVKSFKSIKSSFATASKIIFILSFKN